jgi:hypothetical protein
LGFIIVFVIIVVIEAEVTNRTLVVFLAMLKAKSANDTRVRGWCVYSKEVTWVSVLHRRSDGSLQGSHHGGKDNE